MQGRTPPSRSTSSTQTPYRLRGPLPRFPVLLVGLCALLLTALPACQQTITPGELRFGPIEPDDYQVFVSKTRVHFRRGFDETGYVPTNIIVGAPGDWFGTIRLAALDYENAPIDRFYPFGEPGDWRGRALNPGVSTP